MQKARLERRKYERFDTEMKVCFRVSYDFKTRVKFKLLETKRCVHDSKRHSGYSKNISVEGICFISRTKLNKGDILMLDVFVPKSEKSIPMKGQVCWCHMISGKSTYATGVKILSVNEKVVSRSIHVDKKYKVVWSAVLESLFGDFKKMVGKIRKAKT